jgi:hypothetical protein
MTNPLFEDMNGDGLVDKVTALPNGLMYYENNGHQGHSQGYKIPGSEGFAKDSILYPYVEDEKIGIIVHTSSGAHYFQNNIK